MANAVKIRVLLVDDEPAITDIVKRFLERPGDISVDISFSAGDALRQLDHNAYDAVVSDYEMPDMDGITFLKTVRERDMLIPFIVFTGKGREKVVIEALNNGADFYLQKGGDPASQFTELLSKIRKGVNQRKAERELAEKTDILDAILTASPHGIALVRDRKIQWVNEAFARMLEYTKGELIDMDPCALYENQDICDVVTDQIDADLVIKQRSDLRTRFRQKSGILIDCELNIVPLEEKKPEYGNMITVTDITRRLALAREIERLSAFPNLEANPVIELNQNGQISYFNEAAIEELVRFGSGSTLEVFIPPDFSDLLSSMDQGDTRNTERTITIGNETYREHITISPRFKVIRISVVNTSRQQKMQTAIREMEEALRESDSLSGT